MRGASWSATKPKIVAWWTKDGDTPIPHKRGNWAAVFTGRVGADAWCFQTWSSSLSFKAPTLEKAIHIWYHQNLIASWRREITLEDPGVEPDPSSVRQIDRLCEENARLTGLLEEAQNALAHSIPVGVPVPLGVLGMLQRIEVIGIQECDVTQEAITGGSFYRIDLRLMGRPKGTV